MDVANLTAQLNAGVIIPEAIVLGTLLIVLIGDLIVGRSQASKWTPYVAIAGLIGAVVALYFQWDITDSTAFLGAFSGDALSVIFRGIIAAAAAITVLMSVRYVEQ